MDSAWHLGPLALSSSVLTVFIALTLGYVVGVRLGRAAGIDAGPTLWRVALVGLVVGRVAFVWQWRGSYLDHPLAILDIRDGGWSLESGFIAAALYGFYRIRDELRLRRSLVASLVVSGATFAIGSVASLALSGGGSGMPGLQLKSLDGDPVSLSAFNGRPTVLNLWATWCGPCRREMPLLQEAQQSASDIHFVFVNQGEAPETIREYLSQHRIALRNVLLDRRLHAGSTFGQRALPTTLFFDAQGRLVATRVGELSAATLAQRLAPLRPGGFAPNDAR